MPKPDPARTLATMAAFPEHVDIEVLIFWQDLAHRQTAPPAASSLFRRDGGGGPEMGAPSPDEAGLPTTAATGRAAPRPW